MSIDDPTSAILALNESDERQRSPVRRFAKPFLDLVKLLAPPGASIPIGGLAAALTWLDQQSTENLKELAKVLADEIKYRGAQIERLIRESEAHQAFAAQELPGLVLDAIRRAETARAKDRIHRLARILVHSMEVLQPDAPDHVEEMFRIAMELEQQDVRVLREIVKVQKHRLKAETGRVRPYDAHSSDRTVRNSLRQEGFIEGRVDSICAKLESFGLISKTERNANLVSDEPTPFALLKKGVEFVEYIRSAGDAK